jgi:hypothetical protein
MSLYESYMWNNLFERTISYWYHKDFSIQLTRSAGTGNLKHERTRRSAGISPLCERLLRMIDCAPLLSAILL